MTDVLLRKLEDKVLTLITELESLRKEIGNLRQENIALRIEKTKQVEKLQGLVTMLDALDGIDNAVAAAEAPVYQGMQDESVVSLA